MKIKCELLGCGRSRDLPTGHVNRSRQQGNRLFCSRACAGLARRAPPKTKAQKVVEKRLYDMEYREKNRAMLRVKKAERFQRTYDPEKAAIERKKNMARHVAYCQRTEYRAWKQEYDKRYRATAEYGQFAEAFMLLLDLEREIDSRADFYELAIQKNTVNKTQKRKREYEQLISNQS